MNVVYERSGGFVGMMQSLRIESGTLRARDKGRVLSARDLTPEEAEQLRSLLERAAAAEPPIDNVGAQRSSDAYSVMLSFGDEPEPRVSLSTVTLPVMGAGEIWDELLAWFDRRLTAELQAGKPNAPQILSTSDLDKEE